MKSPHEIILAPVVTEQSTDLIQSCNSYTFVVSLHANKIEIAQAIKALYKVDVVSVNTLVDHGRAKRTGRGPLGMTPKFKKAIIRVKAGQQIDIFEIS